MMRQDGKAECPNLIRRVAVFRNAVRAGDDGVNGFISQDGRRHIVGNETAGNARRHEFIRRQPRALQERPRLIGVDASDLAARVERRNDAERRPDARRRERSGVAMREERQIFAPGK